MKALVLTNQNLNVTTVEKPEQAAPGHIIVKMAYSAINSGDKFFLKAPPIPGMVNSLYGIRGVSGVGRVEAIGDGTPADYLGRYVTIYRQLKYTDTAVGTWSEYAHLPFHTSAILPEGVDPLDYSGSMVNIITPYGFLKDIIAEGHKGIVATAGNSATGIALLGFCLAYDFPLLSIVRKEEGRKELEALGAKHVVVQNSPNFKEEFRAAAEALGATAIFDGVGGQVLNTIVGVLPANSIIYSYGYIGNSTPFTVDLTILSLRNILVRPFYNFKTTTVSDPVKLEEAQKEIGRLLSMPHFKTRIGKHFRIEDFDAALAFQSTDGGKPVFDYGL